MPGDHRAAQLRSYKEAPSPLPLSRERERGMPSAGRRRGSIVGARLCRAIIAQRSCAPTNYAYNNRPRGSGMGRPSSLAVSIHSAITC